LAFSPSSAGVVPGNVSENTCGVESRITEVSGPGFRKVFNQMSIPDLSKSSLKAATSSITDREQGLCHNGKEPSLGLRDAPFLSIHERGDLKLQ
jgi:hypothetical protein